MAWLRTAFDPGDSGDFRVGDTVRMQMLLQPYDGNIFDRAVVALKSPACVTMIVDVGSGAGIHMFHGYRVALSFRTANMVGSELWRCYTTGVNMIENTTTELTQGHVGLSHRLWRVLTRDELPPLDAVTRAHAGENLILVDTDKLVYDNGYCYRPVDVGEPESPDDSTRGTGRWYRKVGPVGTVNLLLGVTERDWRLPSYPFTRANGWRVITKDDADNGVQVGDVSVRRSGILIADSSWAGKSLDDFVDPEGIRSAYRYVGKKPYQFRDAELKKLERALKSVRSPEMKRTHKLDECLRIVELEGRAVLELDDSPKAEMDRNHLIELNEGPILAFPWRSDGLGLGSAHAYVIVRND